MLVKTIRCLLLLLLVGCSEPPVQKLEGFAQGTTYHISYWSNQVIDNQMIKNAVTQEFAIIDRLLSNYRPDSDIEVFNSNENTDSQTINAEIVTLVKTAQSVSQISQGCYDLTIKPLFELWGFKNDKLNIPDASTLKTTLDRVGMDKLEIVDPSHLRKKLPTLKIDLSSIAQGYSVERISQVLEQQGIQNYLVEIGGELKTRGQKPDTSNWRIAIEKPLAGTQQTIQKIITLPKDTATAVMTSGTYRHYFDADGKSYSHILDARTGTPVTHPLVSVTVLHENPTLADAWSTALLCLGQQEGLRTANAQNLSALFIEQQNQQLIETRSNALADAKNISIH